MAVTAPHPKTFLGPRGLRPKSSFGQNFLADDAHLDAIARVVLSLRAHDRAPVVELGAGAGALTHVLLQAGARVHAVERDRDLVPILRERFSDAVEEGRFEVHEDNALTFPFEAHTAGTGVLCGNLPYHLTSSLVLRAVEGVAALRGVAFLVQLEVAERLAARPGGKDWGVLAVLLQRSFDVQLTHEVPRGAFWPVPEVDGGVVRMVPHAQARGGEVPATAFHQVVKAAFQQRRKTLKNTLASLGGASLILEAGLDPSVRAEQLEVEDFVALARVLAARVAEGAGA